MFSSLCLRQYTSSKWHFSSNLRGSAFTSKPALPCPPYTPYIAIYSAVICSSLQSRHFATLFPTPSLRANWWSRRRVGRSNTRTIPELRRRRNTPSFPSFLPNSSGLYSRFSPRDRRRVLASPVSSFIVIDFSAECTRGQRTSSAAPSGSQYRSARASCSCIRSSGAHCSLSWPLFGVQDCKRRPTSPIGGASSPPANRDCRIFGRLLSLCHKYHG